MSVGPVSVSHMLLDLQASERTVLSAGYTSCTSSHLHVFRRWLFEQEVRSSYELKLVRSFVSRLCSAESEQHVASLRPLWALRTVGQHAVCLQKS